MCLYSTHNITRQRKRTRTRNFRIVRSRILYVHVTCRTYRIRFPVKRHVRGRIRIQTTQRQFIVPVEIEGRKCITLVYFHG